MIVYSNTGTVFIDSDTDTGTSTCYRPVNFGSYKVTDTAVDVHVVYRSRRSPTVVSYSYYKKEAVSHKKIPMMPKGIYPIDVKKFNNITYFESGKHIRYVLGSMWVRGRASKNLSFRTKKFVGIDLRR